MAYPYLFPSFYVDEEGLQNRHQFYFDMSLENKATRSLSFAAPTTLTINPFLTNGVLEFIHDVEAGTIGTATVTFQVSNEAIEGSNGIREILRGYDPHSYAWHLRLFHRIGTGTYDCVFWGFIDMNDPRNKAEIWQDKTTWTLDLAVKDTIFLLEDEEYCRPLDLAGKLLHVDHDYTAEAIKVYDHDAESTDPEATQDAGTVQALNWIQQKDGGSNPIRPMFDDGASPGWMTFYKFTDILDAFSELLNLGNTFNDGAGLTHSWKFIVKNNAGAKVEFDINSMYVVSSLYTGGVYQEFYTLFDGDKVGQISLYQFGNALEALKYFITPFGLTARVIVKYSGGTYSRVLQIDQILTLRGSSITVTEGDIINGTGEEASEQVISGFKVVGANSASYIEGSDGDGSRSMNCWYNTLTAVPIKWHGEIAEVLPLYLTDMVETVYASIFFSNSTPTPVTSPARNRLAFMYSPHRIEVWASGDEVNIYYGRTHEYNDSIVLAACAKEYYNALSRTSSKVGYLRRFGKDMNFGIGNLDLLSNSQRAGSGVTLDSVQYWAKKVAFDLANVRTDFEVYGDQ